MAGPAGRWGVLLGVGAVWWWSVLRLALTDEAGVLEGAVAAGGWGLSLLPVHCVPEKTASRALFGAGRRRRTAMGRMPAAADPPAAGPGDGHRPPASADTGGPPSGAGRASLGPGEGDAGPG
ncbi:hypothetical protein ABZ920_27740 [Streptomyces sp. NPDC046831]|uniref:hypothetical protein n=1 Tax=Streptomyces sp. NPDC046831 TaxID=3154805 RepID=UPI0033CCFBDB